jgi:hypothetical protein
MKSVVDHILKKSLTIISTLAILVGILGRIITLNVDPINSPYAMAWKVTWIVNPIGLIIAIYLYSKNEHSVLY